MRLLSMVPPSVLNVEAGFPPPMISALTLNFGAPFAPQVQEYFRSLGDPRGFNRVALVGQGVAAIMAMAALELLGGLPQIALVPFGTREVAGWLPASDFRHNVCRNLRDAEPGAVPAGFTVIDGGGRGLTPAQLEQLAELLGCSVKEIRVSSTNPGQVGIADLTGEAGVRVAEGICDAMKTAGFPVAEVGEASSRLLFLPAGAGIVAAVQGLALYGFLGSWPRTIRLAGSPAEGFRVAEICDPQAMRQWAAGLAAQVDAATPRVTLSGALPDGFRDALLVLAAEHGVEVRG